MQTFRKLESAGKVNQRGIRQNLRLRAQAPKKRTDRLSVALFNNNLHGARDSAPAHVKHSSNVPHASHTGSKKRKKAAQSDAQAGKNKGYPDFLVDWLIS
ncbi:hypothetical protein MFKK_15380 [Halopseudomonas aestusnigri]|nr:hypothetical protein MFKK_15380 [Halopseudomonas aestusnigri]